jgi:hypothetical protein
MLCLAAVLGSAVSSCQVDEPEPTSVAPAAQITTGSWRLDAIQENGQTTSSGTGIKDRFSLTFRPNATYTQRLLGTNDAYDGTWMLMNNNTMLHFVDHKGASHEYTVRTLTATELRYSYTNKDNKLQEFVFSAQP